MMEIPISGIIVHSGKDSDGKHSHRMYITSWNSRPFHAHEFGGVTSFDVGHNHHYAGVTQPAPSGVPHVHLYSTITSFNDGHSHHIRGETGPAIPLPGGGHYHVFRGVTSVNGAIPHEHRYEGTTGNEVFPG